jgi:hypothetical protein
MAIAKIEPSGCTARKGKVQLRFSLYLEPGDPRYEEHHVKVDGEWRDNPFHNHFVYVDADATDAEIQRLLAESLEEFFGLWVKGVSILEAWKTRPLQSRRHVQQEYKEMPAKGQGYSKTGCRVSGGGNQWLILILAHQL